MAAVFRSFVRNFASAIRYTKSHEWVKAENGVATVGISDFAQAALGDVVYLDFPKVGAKLKQSESFGSIESVKATSDLYAPVAGEVVATNQDAISSSWNIVNTSAEDQGWIVKIKMADPKQIESLMDSAAYKNHLATAEH
eukprot:m.223776 g.223776  ORF g.223776 m.223776 type:complete len:140 (-) comp16321_c0_seq1:185-604(-)